MILTDLLDGESVFLDANILVYHEWRAGGRQPPGAGR
jgi:hypothetical protein